MTHLLVAGLVILTILIIGFVWAWLGATPKTEQYRYYKSISNDKSMRNRAWDAAVARAHDRHHP